MFLNCVVCKENTNKYKCPKCIEPYCSLQCYKEHKKVECKPFTSSNNKTEDEDPTIFPPFKTEDTVDLAKLKELRNCEPLKNLLNNPHLRNLLREIDVAPNAWNAIKVAMQEPLFIEFADECLKVVEPVNDKEDMIS